MRTKCTFKSSVLFLAIFLKAELTTSASSPAFEEDHDMIGIDYIEHT